MTGVGSFTVAASHPALAGHFPGRPIVPGVVLLDEAAALLVGDGLRVLGFPHLRFARPVRPGDLVEVSRDGAQFACSVAGEAVLRGTIRVG